MNGKAALVVRVLEAVRQRALTNRLGQVTCDDACTDVHGWSIMARRKGWPCPYCRAVV